MKVQEVFMMDMGNDKKHDHKTAEKHHDHGDPDLIGDCCLK